MKKQITIELDKNEIEFLVLAQAYPDYTTDELRKLMKKVDIRWGIKETGNVDRGDYKIDIEKAVIFIEDGQ